MHPVFMSETAFISVEDVGGAVDRSRASVYRLIKRGELPAVRIGGSIRIPRGAFEQWLVDREQEALASVRRREE